jgi:transposase-like protein
MIDMECKYCHASKVVKSGVRFGLQRYLCKNCSHKFYDNQVSQPRMRVNTSAIISALDIYYGGCSMRKTAELLESIYGEKVSQSTVHFWIHKFAKLVATELMPLLEAKGNLALSGKYHHDETEIRVNGKGQFVWQTLDQESRYIVAHLLSDGRTTEDAKKVFQMGKDKQKPIVLFTDGSLSYDNAFYAVFDTPFKSSTTEWIRRVGIRARETNNIVERAHSTLKMRCLPMRGLKGERAASELLDGYFINYNYCRKHQAIKKTPAEAAGQTIKGWKQLIEKATESKTQQEIEARKIEVQVRS